MSKTNIVTYHIMAGPIKKIIKMLLRQFGGDSFPATALKMGLPMLNTLQTMGLVGKEGSRGEYYIKLANVADQFRDMASEVGDARGGSGGGGFGRSGGGFGGGRYGRL
jgi:hypothetical protein